MPVTATMVSQYLANTANAIAQISDMAKRRKFEQNLASLSLDQKMALDKQLMDANSDSARQQILGDVLGKLDVARINGLTTVQTEKEKTNKTVMTVGIIAASVLVLGFMFITLKKKK